MILSELSIHHLRNIISASIKLHPRFNFIVGPNGSGKTSVLEALYLLSCGHSFRSREISPLITHNESSLTLFAKAVDSKSVSIQKSQNTPTLIKLNHQFCRTTSELAYALPCLVVYSDVFEIINAGPSTRRSVLDWGMFHVKHNYLPVLKDYKKVLKHRNALLRSRAPYNQFIPWDEQLSSLAEQLDEFRKSYFIRLQERFFEVLNQLTAVSCTISYYKGWDRKGAEKPLSDILKEQFEADCHRMYTQYGAHQADLIITSDENHAKQVLSRGQQKMILLALKLAQGLLVESDVLYLFDDFTAELDARHLSALINYLNRAKGQYVLTTTQMDESLRSLLVPDINCVELDKICTQS